MARLWALRQITALGSLGQHALWMDDSAMTILEEAQQYIAQWPQVRLGQAVWNVAISRCPSVRFLAGGYLDPFYDDARVDAFLARIKELWGVQ